MQSLIKDDDVKKNIQKLVENNKLEFGRIIPDCSSHEFSNQIISKDSNHYFGETFEGEPHGFGIEIAEDKNSVDKS